MYYDTTPYKAPVPVVRDDRTHALVNILPREGKRLIARGVLALPEVKRVLENLKITSDVAKVKCRWQRPNVAALKDNFRDGLRQMSLR